MFDEKFSRIPFFQQGWKTSIEKGKKDFKDIE